MFLSFLMYNTFLCVAMSALCQTNISRNFRIWIFCVSFKKAFISNQAEHFISVIVYPLLLWDEENGTLGETFHHSTYRYNIVIFLAPPYGFIIVVYHKRS